MQKQSFFVFLGENCSGKKETEAIFLSFGDDAMKKKEYLCINVNLKAKTV